MSAVGIIAEFDPFHDGHAYLIREARKLTGADHVVVAMSGDFVERGEPAVFDKFERARAAVRGGADVDRLRDVGSKDLLRGGSETSLCHRSCGQYLLWE